jgi:hypothetical protein
MYAIRILKNNSQPYEHYNEYYYEMFMGEFQCGYFLSHEQCIGKFSGYSWHAYKYPKDTYEDKDIARRYWEYNKIESLDIEIIKVSISSIT